MNDDYLAAAFLILLVTFLSVYGLVYISSPPSISHRQLITLCESKNVVYLDQVTITCEVFK